MAGRVRGSAQEGRGRVVNSPENALPPKRGRRLDPEDRQREIVDGAVAFFAEVGFDGGLRDLAKRLGITHQNPVPLFSNQRGPYRARLQRGLPGSVATRVGGRSPRRDETTREASN